MSTTLYGIPNCSSVKAARIWLDQHHVAYQFHDFRQDGLDRATLDAWIGQLGFAPLLNKASATYRSLPDETKAGIVDNRSAAEAMLANPTMIKRPVLVRDGMVTCGFKPDAYESLF